MAKFKRVFRSSTFGIETRGDITRWTMEFKNGRKFYSANSWSGQGGPEQAKTAVGEYISMCEAKFSRLPNGKGVWVIFQVMSPKTLRSRDVFYNGEVS